MGAGATGGGRGGGGAALCGIDQEGGETGPMGAAPCGGSVGDGAAAACGIDQEGGETGGVGAAATGGGGGGGGAAWAAPQTAQNRSPGAVRGAPQVEQKPNDVAISYLPEGRSVGRCPPIPRILPRDASARAGLASGSARSRRPVCGPRVQASSPEAYCRTGKGVSAWARGVAPARARHRPGERPRSWFRLTGPAIAGGTGRGATMTPGAWLELGRSAELASPEPSPKAGTARPRQGHRHCCQRLPRPGPDRRTAAWRCGCCERRPLSRSS